MRLLSLTAHRLQNRKYVKGAICVTRYEVYAHILCALSDEPQTFAQLCKRAPILNHALRFVEKGLQLYANVTTVPDGDSIRTLYTLRKMNVARHPEKDREHVEPDGNHNKHA